MVRLALCSLTLVSVAVAPAFADLELSPGTKIVFGDNSVLSTAPTSGGAIPPGHGGTNNTVSGTDAYIGGGSSNTTSNIYTTISAGFANSVAAQYGTVGGGRQNSVSTNGTYGTSSGGWGNIVSGYAATVAGGQSNAASGISSTVPGGFGNVASGNYSFAAGRRAKVSGVGSFTFTDSLDQDFTTSGSNIFAARATGGVFFFTKVSGGTELMQFDASGNLAITGTLIELSDRNAKENFRPVEERDILDLLAEMPIESYNYKGEDPNVVHMGVMAQDFNDAFGLGGRPGQIANIDAHGVAFASIQALYKLVQDQNVRIARLEKALEGAGVAVP